MQQLTGYERKTKNFSLKIELLNCRIYQWNSGTDLESRFFKTDSYQNI